MLILLQLTMCITDHESAYISVCVGVDDVTAFDIILYLRKHLWDENLTNFVTDVSLAKV